VASAWTYDGYLWSLHQLQSGWPEGCKLAIWQPGRAKYLVGTFDNAVDRGEAKSRMVRKEMTTGARRETASAVLGARSGGDAVRVEQPTETVGSLDTVRALELLHGQVGDRPSRLIPRCGRSRL
jgi:hypothetical protein